MSTALTLQNAIRRMRGFKVTLNTSNKHCRACSVVDSRNNIGTRIEHLS